MKHTLILGALALCAAAQAYVKVPASMAEDSGGAMSKAYWDFWNPEQQKRIDADIEANRKADARIKIGSIKDGTEVVVEQISHDFIFGAHIFNFDQLGDASLDAKYKALYGTLFNSATVSFYWSPFEMMQNRPRFKGEYWDSPDFWSKCADPKNQPHWRRPAADPAVDYCKERGVRVHGHPLVWGNRSWQIPAWMFDACLKGKEKAEFDKLVEKYNTFGVKSKAEVYTEAYKKLSVKQLEDIFPEFAANLKALFKKRIVEIADYYKGKIDSWDVVNESAVDFKGDNMNVGGKLAKSRYGVMPADYTFEGFQVAQSVFPQSVKLNINDYLMEPAYCAQVKDLLARGCKVDIQGAQMHLFKPSQTLDIAAGKNLRTPDEIRATMQTIGAGLPIHLSEITITAPDTTEKGRMMQAIIARNLYRLWFSIKPMMGITWWNVVDDCGAPGEPSMSGIFTRGMNPKPAFFALDGLINGEWKTNLLLKPDAEGYINFRGFRGKYRISWTTPDGKDEFLYYHLK